MNKKYQRIFKSSVTALTLMLSMGSSRAAQAASAVAFDRETSTYAYVHSAQSETEARTRALDGCHRRNGRNCQVIASCSVGGYGAIAVRRLPGRPIEAIGVACGIADGEQALQLAAEECNRFAISNRCGRPTVGWRDPVAGY